MRASSRLHFPRALSMLEIPPEADRRPDPDLHQRLKSMIGPLTWSIIVQKRKHGDPNPDLVLYARQAGCTVVEIESILDEELGVQAGPSASQAAPGPVGAGDPAAEQAALSEEWIALMSNRPDQPTWSRFLTEQGDPKALGAPFGEIVDRLVLVHRVREVRAYYGYQRMSSDRARSDLVGATRKNADGRLATTWLPAHEVIGEGVFVQRSTGRPRALVRGCRQR